MSYSRAKLGSLHPFSQTLSSLNERTKREFGSMTSRFEQQKVILSQIEHTGGSIEHKIDRLATVANGNSEAMAKKIETANTSITNLRALGSQILDFLKTFPQEIRDRLQSITQADSRTYQAILRVQEHLARSPSSLNETNIHFTNSLGEHNSLPYQYFCQWEVCV